MSAEPRRTSNTTREDEAGTRLIPEDHTALTRRASVILGGKLVAAAGGLWVALSELTAEAKKKNKNKKKKNKKKGKAKKKRPSDFILVAENMTGSEEVPGPGDDDASGSGTFRIRPNGKICCDFEFSSGAEESPVILVHIHDGADGIQGPPVVNFNGLLETCVDIESDLADEIKANPAEFYANIHTEEFPDGAVRAQLSLP